MKPGTNGRRPRGRPNRKQHGGPARPSNFDSGQEGRGRGNAHQVYERYLALARDAVTAGDRVASETYYQHAEHYFRILNASTDPQPNGQGRQDRQGGDTRHEGGQQGGGQQGGSQQEGGQQGGGQQEAGRHQDHRQDGHRHEASRPAAQEPGESPGGGQPPTPQISMPPTSTPRDPAANGQDTPPAAARPAGQGGRHRRPPQARNATARNATAHEGGQRGGDAPQAQSNTQPVPQPQPDAQPGPRIDGSCEPTSD